MSTGQRKSRKRLVLKILSLLIVLLLGWADYDLNGPRTAQSLTLSVHQISCGRLEFLEAV